MVAGSFARAQQPLQLGHGQQRGHALGVFSVRGPGAAPGPGEPGHKRHLICVWFYSASEVLQGELRGHVDSFIFALGGWMGR